MLNQYFIVPNGMYEFIMAWRKDNQFDAFNQIVESHYQMDLWEVMERQYKWQVAL